MLVFLPVKDVCRRRKQKAEPDRVSRLGPYPTTDEVLLHPLPPWVVNRAGYSGQVADVERVKCFGTEEVPCGTYAVCGG